MSVIEIKLESFAFPRDLGSDHANFRFVVGLRFVDEKGKLQTTHAVLPGLDSFWECARRKQEEPNYVRDGEKPSFDMDRVGPWETFIFRVRAEELKQIQFKVFDVNRKGAWETFKSVIEKIPQAFAGILGPALPVANELASAAVAVAAGSDKLLFRGSYDYSLQDNNTIRGQGKEGGYTIIFSNATVAGE